MPIVVSIKRFPDQIPLTEVTVTGEVGDKVEEVAIVYKAIIKELEEKTND